MKQILIIILFMIIILATYMVLSFVQFFPNQALKNQLESILQAHDLAAIQYIALDQPTMDYLLQLPKDTKVKNTTDFQGVGYKVTKLGDKSLHVFMKSDTQSIYHKLFPKWTLYKVTIAPNPALFSIRDIEKNEINLKRLNGRL